MLCCVTFKMWLHIGVSAHEYVALPKLGAVLCARKTIRGAPASFFSYPCDVHSKFLS